MRNRKHARGLSLLLCAVLLAGQLGTTIYAEGTASDTDCVNTTRSIQLNAAMWKQWRAIAVNTTTQTTVTRTN